MFGNYPIGTKLGIVTANNTPDNNHRTIIREPLIRTQTKEGYYLH
jgi:hypothetical protein